MEISPENLAELQRCKTRLASILESKDISASDTESLYNLVEKVLKIGKNNLVAKILTDLESYSIIDEDGEIGELRGNGLCQATALKELYLPECTELDSNSIDSCGSLTDLYLPKVVISNTYSLYNCNNLTEYYLPELTNLLNGGFNNNTKISIIYLPKLNTLGEQSCQNINSLVSFYAPLLTSIGSNNFNNTNFIKCYDIFSAITASICTLLLQFT